MPLGYHRDGHPIFTKELFAGCRTLLSWSRTEASAARVTASDSDACGSHGIVSSTDIW